MKTLNDFIREHELCTMLEDFVLTLAEWSEYESGTIAYRVKTYNDSGRLISREYVLIGLDNTEDILDDMRAVSSGYYTETCKVYVK